MKLRSGLLVIPPLLLTLGMILVTQSIFLSASLREDMGLGRLSEDLTVVNYVTILTDPLYLDSMVLTLRLTILVVVLTVLVTYPVAYVLARMTPRWSMIILSAIVASSFISIAIKVLGMVIIFAADGVVVKALQTLGVTDSGFKILGTVPGVVVGLSHLAIGFMVMMLFSVIQTIPPRLEEAAQIHGASRLRVFWRVILPLSLPGLVSASLILFNLLMGAFVSATLLGGGKILTFPVLIQRTLMIFSDYGMAAALSAALLFLVLAINIVSVLAVTRLRAAAQAVT